VIDADEDPFTIGPVPQAVDRARSRIWARFKAGR